MAINTSYQHPPWVPPPRESDVGTAIAQSFAQGLVRGQQQRQHEDELRLREEEALRQQQVHERTTALASRRFAATAAFQDAMKRDLALADTQVANLGEAVDEDTMARIASRNFLLYGAAMNEGGGGSGGLSSFIGRQQTAGYRDAQLGLKERQLDQRDTSLEQGEDRLILGRDAQAIQRGNQVLRRGAAVQSATGLEAKLRDDGWVPTVSGAPPGTLPPDASGNQPATGLVAPAARSLTTGAATVTQTGLQKDMESIASLDEAIAAAIAHPEAFGVQGKVRKVGELVKGQLQPGKVQATPITDTQQKAAKAFAAVAGSLKVDSQLNKDELRMVKDIGETLEASEAPQTALNKLNNLRLWNYRNAVRKAKALGTLPVLLQGLPRTALRALYQSGELSAELVRAENERRNEDTPIPATDPSVNPPGQNQRFMLGE